MAWTAPITAVDGAAFTAAQFNASVRDNLLETMPAKAANQGEYFVTDATNSIAARIADDDLVLTSETSSSTSYTDLATSGPAVTATTGTAAWVDFGNQSGNDNTAQGFLMSVDVSGATTLSASDEWSCGMFEGKGANIETTAMSRVKLFTGLTAGSNTFTAKYRVTGGTGTWLDRRLSVIPL